MPGLKRPTLSSANNLEQLSDSFSSDDNLHHSKRKRPRLQNELPVPRLSEEDVSDEEIEAAQVALIAAEARSKAAKPRRGAENGIVESVTCTNFMCHSHLHVELGPLINFIIGHNGSGKSAVLTALTICLGGKASSTNRGNTLKSFIKEGQETSTISVTIKNNDGYQYETYGNSISVERTFNRNGTSAFKLKSSSGKTISTTRATLDEILDYYALQLDNPICVLSQDMARQFLHSSTSSDKYKFFIKGVQLEQMNQDYDLLSENIDSIERTFHKKENNLRVLESSEKDVRARLKILESQERTKDEINQLSGQMAWIQVEEQERNFARIGNELEDAGRLVREAQSHVEDLSVAYDEALRSLDVIRSAEEELVRQASPIGAELDCAKLAQQAAESELSEARVEERKIRAHLTRNREVEDRVRKEIAEEEARLQEASGGAVTLRLEQQRKCKMELDEARKAYNQEKAKVRELSDNETATKRAWHNAQQQLRTKESDIQQAQNRLDHVKKSGPRQDYPQKLRELLAAVENDSNFCQKPVGPIGNYMYLLKPLWANVLEKTFGSVLNSFIVVTKSDRDRLNSLMKKLNCICPITIQNTASRFLVSANEPALDFDTIARVLRIDNDLVFNFLVINQRIEQLLLIESEAEAVTLMSHQRISNVKACYTRDQRDSHVGHTLTWGISGGLSNNFVDLKNAPSRIRIDTVDQIRAHEDQIARMNTEKSSLEFDSFQKRADFEAASKERQRFAKTIEEKRLDVQHKEEALENADEEIRRGTIEEGRLAALNESLEQIRRENEFNRTAFEVTITAKDRHKEAVKSCEIEKRKTETRLNEVQARLSREVHRRENLEKRKLEVLQMKNKGFEKLDKEKERKFDISSQREDQREKLESYIQQAGEVCSRCPVPQGATITSLDQRLRKLHAQVERFESEVGGDQLKLLQDHLAAKRALKEFEEAFDAEKDLLQLLKRTLNERQERWRLFRKHIAARAKTKFMYLLSERAFRGKLLVDHSKRLMELRIQPNESETHAAARQTKTLSGGEKSFSTICLLLALWEAIGAPIRCLDEFDVFMDNANRDISMKLLINAARDAHDRQFIFITPQSMGSIDLSHDVKIIKMRDPERGQTILPFPGKGF